MGSGVYLDENIRGMAADLRIEAGFLPHNSTVKTSAIRQ